MFHCLGMASLYLAISVSTWLGVPELLPKNPLVPDGYRAVAVRVTTVKDQTCFILPGAKVDVIGSFQKEAKDKQETRVLVQNVLVLAVEALVPPPTEQNEDKAKAPEPKELTITVVVRVEDVKGLTAAMKKGEIRMTLRASDNKENK